jgi:hypothetical protein
LNIIQAIEDSRVIGDFLSPAQACLIKGIYGLPLSALELPIFCEATGRAEYVPRAYRDVSVLCGRRSGKSSKVCANIGIHEGCIAKHDLALGEVGVVLIIAPTERQARVTFRYIEARIQNSATLRRLVKKVRSSPNESEIELTNGRTISVQAANSKHLRSTSLVCVILEEGCFFRDSDTGAYNLDEVLKAVRPGMLTMPGSKLVRVSSPWSKSGPMWDDWRLRNERPNTLCWKLPSWIMNPSLPADELARERERDESYFLREYGAEFLDAASALLPTEQVENCVARGQVERAPQNGIIYIGALDAAWKSDAFAFSLAHMEGERAIVDLARHWKPKRGQAVQFGPVLAEIVETMRRFGATQIYGDQVAAEPIKQALAQHGITFTQTVTLGRRASAIYGTLRAKTVSGQLELPDNPELVSQLKRLEVIIGPGGSERCEASTGHDDLAVSAALAVHQAVSHPVAKPWIGFITVRPNERGAFGGPAQTSRDEDDVVWHRIL